MSLPYPGKRPFLASLVLTLTLAGATTSAHATGGITCTSRDGHTRVELNASLSGTDAHAGIVSLTLTRFGSRSNWTLATAGADYPRHTLHVSARHPAAASHTLDLRIAQDTGSLLLQGHRPTVMACDWGEFS